MRKKVLLYSQHLSGTGHFVRMFEIASNLAENCDIYLIDGGRFIPRKKPQFDFKIINISPIFRQEGNLKSVENRHIDQIMLERKQILLELIENIKPDVIIIEHFPFSKWILFDEITNFIKKSKSININVKIICSIRDIPINTCDEPAQDYQEKVTQILEQYFDLILIHSDPDLICLENYIPWLNNLKIPFVYTGYISEKLNINSLNNKQNLILVSLGGLNNRNLILTCAKAWHNLNLDNYKMLIFAPLFISETEFLQVTTEIKNINDNIEFKPFTNNFINYLSQARLSISQAGYNTCMNILETCTPNILIPNQKMSDQIMRSQRLAELNLTTYLDVNNLNIENLSHHIINSLKQEQLNHNINLGGAVITNQIINI